MQIILLLRHPAPLCDKGVQSYQNHQHISNERYANAISKASLAVYGTWFALIVDIDDYEGEFYPETTLPTYKEAAIHEAFIWFGLLERE